MDFFEELNSQFDLEPFKVHTYSPVALAYIGDSIYDLVIRTMIMNQGAKAVGRMHKAANGYVNANAQAKIYFKVADELTEEEQAVFRRGRNAKSGSTPKNADLKTYKQATGLEAVLGYLYLQGDLKRIFELIALGLEGLTEEH